jgi:polar amino acid transport system permease protein
MNEFLEMSTAIGRGISVTLQLLFASFLIGVILGTIIAICRYRKIWGYSFITQIISVIRGTPLILQLSFLYFILPGLLGIKLSVTATGILAFGLNSAAYVAEILRGGIESIPKGQFEAAKTLNIPPYYMWKDIILPQVIARVFPSLVNEMISLLKETAVIQVIGGVDIMRQVEFVAAEKFTYFMPLCIAGIYYYSLVRIIEYAGKKIEKAYAC